MKLIKKLSAGLVAVYEMLIAAGEASYAARNKRVPSDAALKTLGISKEQMVKIHL